MATMQALPDIDSTLQYGAMGLLFLVLVAFLGMAWLLVRAAIRAFDRVVASMELLDRRHELSATAIANRIDALGENMRTRIDIGERHLHRNVDESRHAVRQSVTASQANVQSQIAESEGRISARLGELIARIKSRPPPSPG